MLFHENKITHTVRLGSEMCVFDFWAWRSTFPEPTVENGACECFLTKRVRLVQVPAAFDPTHREHSFHLSQGRWTEQKVEGGRFQEGDGFALNETWQWWWWGGGGGRGGGLCGRDKALSARRQCMLLLNKHMLHLNIKKTHFVM